MLARLDHLEAWIKIHAAECRAEGGQESRRP
jgi:hypothetical protein